MGTEDGPSVLTKIRSTLYYCKCLRTNLGLGVCGFDEFYDLRGCEIVGWVSEKSGCLWFPAKMMSINLFEHT